MATECIWCIPNNEVCGTCKRYFDFNGDGNDKCSSLSDDCACAVYEPINYCPNCGRKLVTEDGNWKTAD